MVDKTLPKELISLIHNIELNKVGWWEKSIQQLILFSIWQSNQPLTCKDISTYLFDNFSISLDRSRFKNLAEDMCSTGTLILGLDGKYKISHETKNDFKNKNNYFNELESRILKKFGKILEDYNLDLEVQKTYNLFKEHFLIPFVHEMGAKTYEVISGNSIEIKKANYNKFISKFAKKYRNDIKEVIFTFLDPKDEDIRSCIFQELNAYFLLVSCNLSDKDIIAINRLNKHPPSFRIFIDTNFLFHVLELDENPSNEVALLLMDIADKLSNKAKVEFVVLQTTIDESKNTLKSYRNYLKNIALTENFAITATKKEMGLTGVIFKFFKTNTNTLHQIRAEEYFNPYIYNLAEILNSKKIKVFDQDVTKYKLDQRVIDSIIDQQNFEDERSKLF